MMSVPTVEEFTFVDYFIVCGFEDGPDGLQLEKFSDPASQDGTGNSKPPLDRSYVAKVLGRYPEKRHSRPYYPEILPLCMPKGLRFCTQKYLPAEPCFHSFVNIREDGTRVDGCALTFFEEVTNPTICEAMHLLQKMHVEELTGARKGEEKLSLLENGYHPPGQVTGGTHTLPRRGRKGHHSKRVSYYDSGQDALYVSKCIALSGRLPIVGASERILRTFHRLVTSSESPPYPIESYVYWLLHETPLPPPGGTLKVTLEKEDIICQRPGGNELPFFDYRLREVFYLLNVEKFLKIYSCMLLEHQILICSKVLQRMMLVAECLVSLAFPFRWQHVYVPILPYSQASFLDAPLPYIMGLCYDDSIPEEVFKSTACVVDLDTGRLELPEDLPTLPDKADLTKELLEIFERFRDTRLLEMNGAKVSGKKTSKGQSSAASGDKYNTLAHSDAEQKGRVKEDDENNGLDGGVKYRRRGHHARSEERTLKRMSKSFDGDALDWMNENNNASPFLDSDSTNYHGGGVGTQMRNELAPLPLTVLQESESLARLTEITRRVGLNVTLDTLQKELESSDSYKNSPASRKYFQEMKFNNAVREIFLNRFTNLLYTYEHFVLGQGCKDKEMFVSNRDSMQNFDKASFLSDLADSHLPFMAAFIESQMFTSFVDWKIISQWEEPEPNLALFDKRLQDLKDKFGMAMVRTPTYERTLSFTVTEEMITKREENFDYVVPAPHALEGQMSAGIQRREQGVFPELDKSLLGQNPLPHGSPWKRRHGRNRVEVEKHLLEQHSEKYKTNNAGLPVPAYQGTQGSQGQQKDGGTVAEVAQTNWKFVEQLLRETKARTKRMLVDKMGAEAVSLGHTDMSVTGVEENTLVASFCDLLERIWGHGLNRKQGKSAVWSHLLGHQDMEKGVIDLGGGKLMHHGAFLTPEEIGRREVNSNSAAHPVVEYLQSLQKDLGADAAPWSSSLLRAANFIADKMGTASQPVSQAASPTEETAQNKEDFAPSWSSGQAVPVTDVPLPESPRKRSYSRPRSPDLRSTMRAVPTYIAYDLKNVLRMTEIKTDIGFARAFVRLALERKLLHKHIKTLLANQVLLNDLYKRYAFLRCEDEMEQFLYHILSLNAAEFHCFTNSFSKTRIQYQVLLVPGGGRFTLSNTSASVWIKLEGSLGETPSIKLPKNTLQFTFDHKNLGILSTMRLGHELDCDLPSGQSGGPQMAATPPPKWFLEYAVARNEVTGHTYKFPCGRWFGRGVDDGSLERLMVAEILKPPDSDYDSSSSYWKPKLEDRGRSRSPSAQRRLADDPKTRLTEIQHQLGEAVNNIVKHFYRNPEKDQKSQLTRLMCGERGLVTAMEQAFLCGFRTSRFFMKLYPWDYIDKVTIWFVELVRDKRDQVRKEHLTVIRYTYRLVGKISQNPSLGKEGKFQTFVLISVRDHMLHSILPLMAYTPVTANYFDEVSFFRSQSHLNFLIQLLYSLEDFHFEFEQSLTYGLDVGKIV